MNQQTGSQDIATAPHIQTIDGTTLLTALTLATQVIHDHREQLNALNVFPVPDGDTGTNMVMTMRSALDTANRARPSENPPAGFVAERFAYGGLMGARGNSGVILSQILRGFATEIEHLETLDGTAIAAALTNATRVAYQAVVRPVEGTMLTVIADAAHAATAALQHSDAAGVILVAAADAAAESLSHTPESLAVLRQAQVVDAGGQGIAYLLRAMANSITGNLEIIQIGETHPVPSLANINVVEDDIHGGATGYCTNFIVAGSRIDLYQFRERLSTLGTSAVIVGDSDLFKVHVHTDRPDRILTMALEFGSLDRIAIENMERQASEVAANLNQHSGPSTLNAPAIIGHTDGDGLADVLRTMGATSVIADEADFAKEIAAYPGRTIILLPGSEQALQTATHLAQDATRDILVVTSFSVAQEISALSSANPDVSPAVLTRAMNETASATHFAVITRSIGSDDSPTPSGGAYVLKTNGAPDATGVNLSELIHDHLAGMARFDPDIITIFAGQDTSPEETTLVQEALNAIAADAEIETLAGGQTSSRYVLWFD